MSRWWNSLTCVFLHSRYHVQRLYPFQVLSGATAYKLITLCEKCDADILKLLEPPR